MAKGTVLESTSSKEDGRTGIKLTKNKKLDSFTIYRYTKNSAITSKILEAAELFYACREKYTFKTGHWRAGKSVTSDDIKKPSNTTISGIGLAEGCVNYAFTLYAIDEKVTFNFGETNLPGNFGFKKIGSAASNDCKNGDILVKDGDDGQQYVIFTGSSITGKVDVSKDTGDVLQNRWKYPADSSNKYYYSTKVNAFCPSYGPPGAYHNCTWYAYGRYAEIAGFTKKSDLPTGNAQDWWKNYKGKYGSSKPAEGAVVVWAQHHVAVVEKIFDNGDFITSNSAWDGGNPTPSIKPGKKITSHVCSSNKTDSTPYPYFYTEYVTKASGYNSWCGKPQGFIHQPGNFHGLGDDDGGVGGENVVTYIDLAVTSSVLYTSAQFEYLSREEDDSAAKKKSAMQSIKDALDEKSSKSKGTTEKSENVLVDSHFAVTALGKTTGQKAARIPLASGQFKLSDYAIEVPFVALDLEDIVIGTYYGDLDKYPNHIKDLSVKKVNGEINQYTINLIHQIRAGEDPNVLDKVFSKVRYNEAKLLYGDCYTGHVFKEEHLIINNISMSRDYAASRIQYTLTCVSAANYLDSYKMSFPSTYDRPSNVIRGLIYEDPTTSAMIQSAYPSMSNQLIVEKKGLLPTTDDLVQIPAKSNCTIKQYINYLTSLMRNTTRVTAGLNNPFALIGTAVNAVKTVADVLKGQTTGSSFFVNYNDEEFSVKEVTVSPDTTNLSSTLYTVEVGFPDNNQVLDFSVNSNQSWSMLYTHAKVASEYIYSINRDGEVQEDTPSIFAPSNVMNEIEKNWWSNMVTFPISATLKLRGLYKEVSLMDYIDINVTFYGQNHYTSGRYVVTAQQDVLNGSGFVTQLTLLRVSEN